MTAQTRPDELIRILRAEFVTKSGGVPGAACVTFVCGATGWRATGGTIARTLIHEVAFQLTDAGNARGANAIDLQIVHLPFWAGADVAAAPFSAILTNEENVIDVDCDYAVIAGPWNEILDGSTNNFILGHGSRIFNSSYAVGILGIGMWCDEGSYGTLLGASHQVDDAFGFFICGEQNDQLENVNDYPTYCWQGGILNVMEGDCFVAWQFGERNLMFGLGSAGDEMVYMSGQFGYNHYAQNVKANFQFGLDTKSFLSNADSSGDYYDGRILLSGDNSNATPTDGTSRQGGFNQDSWFSQNDVITTWNVAWTTVRFQFPIIEDSIWIFLLYVAATEKGCVNSHAWKVEGVIENDGGNTTILASTVTNIYRDVATKECQVVADNANDRLAIQFRDTGGPDATWTNIQISIHTVEVGAEV